MKENGFTKINRIVSLAENLPIPAWGIPLIILIYSYLRMYFEEQFICPACLMQGGMPVEMYFHGMSFFIFAYLAGTLVLCKLTRTEFFKVSRLTIIGFVLIIFPPIVDGVLFGRNTIYKYARIVVSASGEKTVYPISHLFFSFHNDMIAGPGLRGEIWAITLLSLIYVLIKTRNFLKSFTALLMIPAIFTFVAYQQVLLQLVRPHFESAIVNLQMQGKRGLDFYFAAVWTIYAVFLLWNAPLKTQSRKFAELMQFPGITLILLTPLALLKEAPAYHVLLYLKLTAGTLASAMVIKGAGNEASISRKAYFFLFGAMLLVFQFPGLPPFCVLIFLTYIILGAFLTFYEIPRPYPWLAFVILSIINSSAFVIWSNTLRSLMG